MPLGEAPQTVKYYQKDIFLRGLSFSDIIQRIDPNTNLIGISILFSFAYPAVKDLIKEIKHKFIDIPLVLGGPHATHLTDYTLMDSNVDYIIIGEGEIPLVHLYNALPPQTGPILELGNFCYK